MRTIWRIAVAAVVVISVAATLAPASATAPATAGNTPDDDKLAIAVGGGACRSYAGALGYTRVFEELVSEPLVDHTDIFSGISGGSWWLAQYLYRPGGLELAPEMTNVKLAFTGAVNFQVDGPLDTGNVFVTRGDFGEATAVTGSGTIGSTSVFFDLKRRVPLFGFLSGSIDVHDSDAGFGIKTPVLFSMPRTIDTPAETSAVTDNSYWFGHKLHWEVANSSGLLPCTTQSDGWVVPLFRALAQSFAETHSLYFPTAIELLLMTSSLQGLDGIRLDSIPANNPKVILGSATFPYYRDFFTQCATEVAGLRQTPSLLEYTNDQYSGISSPMSMTCTNPLETITCDGTDWMSIPGASVVQGANASSAFVSYEVRYIMNAIFGVEDGPASLFLNSRQYLNGSACPHGGAGQMFLDLADGAFVDTTGILQAVKSGATRVISMSMRAGEMDPGGTCDIDAAVKALFVRLTPEEYTECEHDDNNFRQDVRIFADGDAGYNAILDQVIPQHDAGVPVYAYLPGLTTTDNPTYGVEAGQNVDLLIMFLQDSERWPGHESGEATCGSVGGDFPHCSFDLYPLSVAAALADFTEWYARTNDAAAGQEPLCHWVQVLLTGAADDAKCLPANA